MSETLKDAEGPKTSIEEKAPLKKEEKLLSTVEQIRAEREMLEKKIKEAKVQKEKDIAQKFSERESLIGEAVRNDELLLATRETTEYYRTMKELGELRDPEDTQKIEEFESLEKNLIDREAEIKGRIFIIAQQPEIHERLQEEIGKEVTKRIEVITRKEAYEKLEPRVDGVAENIKEVAYRIYSLNEKAVTTNQEAARVDNQANEIEGQALDTYQSATTEKKGGVKYKSRKFYSELVRKYHYESREKYLSRLEKMRKELRFFSGREKAAIDFILSRRGVLEESDRKWQEDKSLREQLFLTREENTQKLAREMAKIDLEAEDKNLGIEKFQLSQRLQYKIAEIADIKRKDPKTDESFEGRYLDWEEAIEADPRNGYLRRLLQDIEKEKQEEKGKLMGERKVKY